MLHGCEILNFLYKCDAVVKYEVAVKTADVDKAETKANVYLNVAGNQGTTGKRRLKKSNQEHMFQRGQVLA